MNYKVWSDSSYQDSMTPQHRILRDPVNYGKGMEKSAKFQFPLCAEIQTVMHEK